MLRNNLVMVLVLFFCAILFSCFPVVAVEVPGDTYTIGLGMYLISQFGKMQS